jgi:glycosyltransferase involved in cell wall biosynthesis
MEYINDYEVFGGTFQKPEAANMKIALVSTGLGRVLRGFESFTASLFDALKRFAPTVDVTLFQGGRCTKADHIWVPNFHRYDVPARWLGYDRGNLLEKRSFALSLYPLLRAGRFDVVHYNELAMGSALFHLRRLFGGKFKLLYCNGAPSPPLQYHHRCNYAQLLTQPMFDEARAFGMPEEKLFLLPYGIDGQRFSPKVRMQRQQVRREIGIPDDAKVILSVAALKREHKRLDYVIKEVSRLGNGVWLVAAGQETNETRDLEALATRMLGTRWRFYAWPHERLPLLYGMADVFVLGSLTEAFGLVTVEALLTGLPVIVHHSPSNIWITSGTPAHLIDLAREGELSKAIEATLRLERTEPSLNPAVEKRFSWNALTPMYIEMYSNIIAPAKS